MEVHIIPIPETAAVNFTIIYGVGDKRQERPYRLDPVPGRPARFVMDERNGIFVDHALLDDMLLAQFAVGTSVLISRFELTDKGLGVEIISSQAEPHRKSKPKGTEIEVQSYPVLTRQHGVLARQ
jgi:hypothetical protein